MSTTNSTLSRLGELPRTVADRAVKLPREVFTGVTTRGRGVWLAGLGAIATAEEEGSQLFSSLAERREKLASQAEQLVERGEQVEAKGRERIAGVRSDLTTRQKELTEQVSSTVQMVETDVTDTLGGALRRLGVPTRGEVRELSEKVDLLTRRVGVLLESMHKPVQSVARPVFSVLNREDGWAVSMAGETDARSVHTTKEEAVDAARSLAAAQAPSQLVIHRKDGTVQDTFSYEA